MPLHTKNVFLTGGAQGLGKSFVEALLAAGAKVVFGDFNPTEAEKTEKELQAKYGKEKVKVIVFDCTDFSKFEEAFAAAIDFLGHVDLMVNNAGMMDENRWQATIQLNFAALVKGTLMAADHMRKDKGGKGGRIINISSIAGLQDFCMIPVYVGTKNAVRGFTSSLSKSPDIQQQGIQFGVLCPSPAATDMMLKDFEARCYRPEAVPVAARQARTAPVESIQTGFMKLVTLEEMNGAVLYVSQHEMTFRRMDNVDLGDTWPVKRGDGTS